MSGQVKSFLDRLSQVRTGRVMSGNQYGKGQFCTVQVRPGLVKFGQVKSESGQMYLTLEFDSSVGPTCIYYVGYESNTEKQLYLA